MKVFEFLSEETQGQIVVNAEFHYLQAAFCLLLQKGNGFPHKDFCAAVLGKPEDTGAYRRHRYALQPFL